jgi:hypothetical protein
VSDETTTAEDGTLPRHLPLSRLNGATPTRAATSRRLSWPSSGICASSKAAVRFPTPLIAVSLEALCESSGEAFDVLLNEQIELFDLLFDLMD